MPLVLPTKEEQYAEYLEQRKIEQRWREMMFPHSPLPNGDAYVLAFIARYVSNIRRCNAALYRPACWEIDLIDDLGTYFGGSLQQAVMEARLMLQKMDNVAELQRLHRSLIGVKF